MNWLLLLSAILSALTGVGASARQPQPTSVVVQQATAAATSRARVAAASRPVPALPALASVARGARPKPLAVRAAAPLYLARLRV